MKLLRDCETLTNAHASFRRLKPTFCETMGTVCRYRLALHASIGGWIEGVQGG